MIQKYHRKEYFWIYQNKLAKQKLNVREIRKSIFFPSQSLVRNHVLIASDPYESAKDSHALVICTEWDEFKVNKFLFYMINTDFYSIIYLAIRLSINL